MLDRLANLVIRRRHIVLAATLVLVLVAPAAGATLFDRLRAGGFDDPGAESGTAAELLEERFGQAEPNLVLLVETPDGVDDPAAARAGSELTERLADQPGVEAVQSYWTGQAPQLRGADEDQALVLATIPGDDDAVEERLDALLPRFEGEQNGLDVQVGGYAMLQHEMNTQSEEDVVRGEMLALPLTLVALVIVFGSLLTAALPLAVAFVTVLFAVCLMWLIASLTDLSILAGNAVTLLGLGLAIDYSLLVVSRYREQLEAGQPRAEAMRATLRTAGRTVVYSALTVAVAISGMLWFPLMSLRSIGYAGIATAFGAAGFALVLLPVLLLAMGERVRRGRALRRRQGSRLEDGFWHRLAMFVMRRPVRIATIVTALLLLVGLPALGMKIGYPDERVLPADSASRQVAETVRADFDASEQNALSVVAPRADESLDGYAAELSQLPQVARVDASVGSYADGTREVAPGPQHGRFAAGDAAYLSVIPQTDDADALDQLVVDVRATDAPFEVLVGGSAAVGHDATAALSERLPYALVAVGVLMFALLFLLTGSVVLPLLSIVLSALSLTAAYGALVWIFQDGHLSDLLGFTATGSLAATIPVMLFALAFGLAMDYQVFLLARIREEYERTGETRAAVALGLERVGRIVTAAAVLISIVFCGFLVSGVSFVKAFGIGLPLAVLVDATLIRGALLPATIRLLGRYAWWSPGWLRRVYGRFRLREEEGPAIGDHGLVPEPVERT